MSREDWKNTLTVREETPDGTGFIQIVENKPGDIDQIFFHIGKAGSSLNSYCFALAELCTELLHRNMSISDLIRRLEGISSDRASSLHTGSKSGAEAIAVALTKYLQSLPETDVSRFRNPTTKDKYPERKET